MYSWQMGRMTGLLMHNKSIELQLSYNVEFRNEKREFKPDSNYRVAVGL